jgi:hypothetical protein
MSTASPPRDPAGQSSTGLQVFLANGYIDISASIMRPAPVAADPAQQRSHDHQLRPESSR